MISGQDRCKCSVATFQLAFGMRSPARAAAAVADLLALHRAAPASCKDDRQDADKAGSDVCQRLLAADLDRRAWEHLDHFRCHLVQTAAKHRLLSLAPLYRKSTLTT